MSTVSDFVATSRGWTRKIPSLLQSDFRLLHLWVTRRDPFERRFQLVRLKAKRSGTALVRHLSILIDQIQPIRPSRISFFDSIVEAIQHGGKLDSELAHARASNERAFFFILRRRKYYIVFQVALHLPHVARMRFKNVDREKTHAASILFVEFVEGGNLPPEGRSSVAPEYQHHWSARIQRRECKVRTLV